MRNNASILFLAIAALWLSGCVPPGYSFSMTRPEATGSTSHSDEHLKAVFVFNGSTLFQDANISETSFVAYDSIELQLTNRSDQPLRIDWNRVRFTDHNGQTDLPVMPKGTDPAKCDQDKPATTVKPGGRLFTRIIPCYAITGSEYETGSMFPPQAKAPEISFALTLPVGIGDEEKVYDFGFRAQQRSESTSDQI